MTLNEIKESIRKAAADHGFTTADSTWSKYPTIESEELNFSIFDHMDGDWENRTATYSLQFQTSVRKMGGNPTVEELLKTADEIKRGAELTAELQSMNLSYTETY